MIKYATAIRLGTASTEAILRRFTRDVTHPAYAAMLELGRAQRRPGGRPGRRGVRRQPGHALPQPQRHREGHRLMTRFKRLTRDDLSNLTRNELLPRLEAEQEYWARKEKRGLSDADRQARKEFTDIVFTVLNPDGLADSMAEDAAWLKGERPTSSSYWDKKPGGDQQ
jgi:hypothetical protein